MPTRNRTPHPVPDAIRANPPAGCGIAPGQQVLAAGHDWSWAFVVFREIPGWPGFLLGSDATVWSCWKVRAKKGLGRRAGTERYQSDQWHRLVGMIRRDGYHAIGDGLPGHLLHALMLMTFIGHRPEGYECRHKNGIPWDNRLSNLVWGTHGQNQADRVVHGTDLRGTKHPLAILDEDKVREIRRMRDAGEPLKSVAERFHISVECVCSIHKRRTWKHVQ